MYRAPGRWPCFAIPGYLEKPWSAYLTGSHLIGTRQYCSRGFIYLGCRVDVRFFNESYFLVTYYGKAVNLNGQGMAVI